MSEYQNPYMVILTNEALSLAQKKRAIKSLVTYKPDAAAQNRENLIAFGECLAELSEHISEITDSAINMNVYPEATAIEYMRSKSLEEPSEIESLFEHSKEVASYCKILKEIGASVRPKLKKGDEFFDDEGAYYARVSIYSTGPDDHIAETIKNGLTKSIKEIKELASYAQPNGQKKSATKTKAAAPTATDEDPMAGINRMVGVQEAKQTFNRQLSTSLLHKNKRDMDMNTEPFTMHMVFTGNPGTGKTKFAKELAQAYHGYGLLESGHMVYATHKDLVADYVGQTAGKATGKLDEAMDGVLVLDEIYSLMREDAGGYGQEVIDALVAELDERRDRLVVVFLGYPEEMEEFINANPGFRSRIAAYVSFDDYPDDELEQIMDLMLEDRSCTPTPDAREKMLQLIQQDKERCAKENIAFANGRTLRNLVEAAEGIQGARLKEKGLFEPGHGGLNDEEFKEALAIITLEDVSQVKLGEIKKNKPKSNGIGFGARL